MDQWLGRFMIPKMTPAPNCVKNTKKQAESASGLEGAGAGGQPPFHTSHFNLVC